MQNNTDWINRESPVWKAALKAASEGKKVRRPRDVKRLAVYKAGWAVGGLARETPMMPYTIPCVDVQFVACLVWHALEDALPGVTLGEVPTVSYNPKRTRVSVSKGGSIELSKGGCNYITLTHEMAHELCKVLHTREAYALTMESHGIEFRDAWLTILRALRDSLKGYKFGGATAGTWHDWLVGEFNNRGITFTKESDMTEFTTVLDSKTEVVTVEPTTVHDIEHTASMELGRRRHNRKVKKQGFGDKIAFPKGADQRLFKASAADLKAGAWK